MSEAVTRLVERRRSGFALSVALGGLLASGQAPLGWAWLSLAVLAAAIALLTLPACWKTAAWRGWALGLGYFGAALSWIVEPFLVDLPRHGWMAPFALLFLAGGLALFWALAFGLAARFGPSQRLRAGWLVVTLTGAEILRSFLFTGFPWALIGHVWIGTPQMQAAALMGRARAHPADARRRRAAHARWARSAPQAVCSSGPRLPPCRRAMATCACRPARRRRPKAARWSA